MKPQKQPSKPSHQDLFQIELDRIINEAHPLVKLSTQMGRQGLDEHFGACFCEEGRPGINTRLMVSLHYLKYANNLSNEETLALWVESPYLQIACVDLSRSAHPCLWLITWDPTETRATRPLAIQKDGTWYCYGHDLTKNVSEVFGSAGNIRTVYSYTPYGEVTAEGNVSQPIQWSSEFKDEELELVYYNFRHYNPAGGRWINRDPIQEEGGWNLYLYCSNTPCFSYDIKGQDRYVSQILPAHLTDMSITLHIGVAVDLWEKDDKGKWCKVGIKTFDYSLDPTDRETGRLAQEWAKTKNPWIALKLGTRIILNILSGTFIIGNGYIEASDGLNLTNPETIPSSRVEDVNMLRGVQQDIASPPLYNIFINNCADWSYKAIWYGRNKT